MQEPEVVDEENELTFGDSRTSIFTALVINSSTKLVQVQDRPNLNLEMRVEQTTPALSQYSRTFHNYIIL